MSGRQLRLASRAAAGAALALALIALLGWVIHAETLERLAPRGTTIKTNTAIAVVALALALLTPTRLRAVRLGLAGFVLALSAAVAAEWAFSVNLGIDELLFKDPAHIAHPNRAVPNTLAALSLLAAGLGLFEWRRTVAARVCAGAGGAIGWAGAVGILSGTNSLSGFSSSTHIALPTSLALVLLALALLLREGMAGLGGLLVRDSAGGALARRLLPASFLVPTVLGALDVAGRRAGLYSSNPGIWLLIVCSIATLTWISWRGASDVDQQESERQKFVFLVETSRDFISMRTLDGRLLYVNAASRRLVGAAADEELRDVSFDRYLAPVGRRAFLEQEQPALERHGYWQGENALLNLGTGDIVDVAVSSVVVRSPDTGEPLYVATVKHDITERKRQSAEIRRLNVELEARVERRTEELRHANAELEAFSYSVAHDLRAPLRAIEGFSSALREDYAPALDDEAQRYIARVCASTTRMAVLIDDLLELSRIGRAEMHEAAVDLAVTAREVAAELQESEPGRDVEFDIPNSLPAFGDAALLRVVLDNLLGNAWKFTSTHESARIEVGSAGANGGREFFVRDDGAGFDMQYVGKLFGPFQRLHGSEFPGTGIGLATVQRIVSRHHGRVWAEGALEHGATFHFTLPDADPQHN